MLPLLSLWLIMVLVRIPLFLITFRGSTVTSAGCLYSLRNQSFIGLKAYFIMMQRAHQSRKALTYSFIQHSLTFSFSTQPTDNSDRGWCTVSESLYILVFVIFLFTIYIIMLVSSLRHFVPWGNKSTTTALDGYSDILYSSWFPEDEPYWL